MIHAPTSIKWNLIAPWALMPSLKHASTLMIHERP